MKKHRNIIIIMAAHLILLKQISHKTNIKENKLHEQIFRATSTSPLIFKPRRGIIYILQA